MTALRASHGPRPRHPSYDAPVPGPSIVYRIDLDEAGPTAGLALLGPGRDYADRDELIARFRETLTALSDAGMHGRFRASQPYETVAEALADPLAEGIEVRLDRTGRSLLRAERAEAEWREANDAWNAAVEADPEVEICDRCGGAGGYSGWPGFTCYECGGRGTVPA